jgi:hypothetical protein
MFSTERRVMVPRTLNDMRGADERLPPRTVVGTYAKPSPPLSF